MAAGALVLKLPGSRFCTSSAMQTASDLAALRMAIWWRELGNCVKNGKKVLQGFGSNGIWTFSGENVRVSSIQWGGGQTTMTRPSLLKLIY